MEKKYKIRFSDEDALQESIVYKLVSEYGIEPVVLRAEIEGRGVADKHGDLQSW